MAMTGERAGEVVRRSWLAVAVAVLCLVPYAALVLPYYANGLHDLPAGETLYTHDLLELWPYDTALGGMIAFIVLLGLPLAPIVASVVVMWSGFSLLDAWRTMTAREIALYVAAAVVSAASIAWLATPLANDLIIWLID